MDLVQAAFLTTVVFAVFLMAVVVIVMIINKEPVKKIDAELDARLKALQEQQIMSQLERRAQVAGLDKKLMAIGLAIKEVAKLTDITSDDTLGDLLIDIATPGVPENPQG